MRFAYIPLPTRRPVYPLGGARWRYRPLVPIHILKPILLAPLTRVLTPEPTIRCFPSGWHAGLGSILIRRPLVKCSRQARVSWQFDTQASVFF